MNSCRPLVVAELLGNGPLLAERHAITHGAPDERRDGVGTPTVTFPRDARQPIDVGQVAPSSMTKRGGLVS